MSYVGNFLMWVVIAGAYRSVLRCLQPLGNLVTSNNPYPQCNIIHIYSSLIETV